MAALYDSDGNKRKRIDIVRELDPMRLGMLLNQIKSNPKDYSATNYGWIDWLSEPAKSSRIDNF